MGKINSKPIRVDTEFFIPEAIQFADKNGLKDKMPDITREIGKFMRNLRLSNKKIQKEIIF